MKYFYDENGKKIGEYNIYPSVKDNDVFNDSSSGKLIGLIVGHDYDSRGAYGDAGVSEWDFNDKFLSELTLSEELPNKHIYYIFYRDAGINGYSNKMIALHKKMDEVGIDISIEFHFNSVADSSVNGNEVLYCSPAGLKIASILDECLDSLDNRDRGVKKVTGNDRGAGFCCRGKSVAIITEPFFGSNQHRFMHGGDQREDLKKAYVNFFNRI